MQTTRPPASARHSLSPIPGTLSCYPAIHRGTFPNPRAALASIGCIGAAADLYLTNAKAEGSPVVAVPVKAANAPRDAGECVGLIQRKPGGRADLFLGLLSLADEDRSEAEAIARTLADSSTRGEVRIMEWVRQPRAVQ